MVLADLVSRYFRTTEESEITRGSFTGRTFFELEQIRNHDHI